MGNGIAHVFAQKGYNVHLVDISKDALSKALNTISKNLDRLIKKEVITTADKEKTLERITTTTDLAQGVSHADLVIEAATENENVKLDIFKLIDANAPESCLLASNTSSLSITKIASVTNRPDKVIGMHFMNPVPIMKLVEVINGYSTSSETTEAIVKLSENIGKTPLVAKDYPGFVANRILIPMINEAIRTLHEGVAGVAEIDGIMKLGMAHPMGPLQLADFIGLDIVLSICKVLYEGLGDDRYAPCPLLTNMVMANKLGRKNGEGFYSYRHDTKELIISSSFS